MGKVFVETIGCPKNLEDSEKAAGLIVSAGHEIAMRPEDADVIVVNTCGFIEDAKRESIETILNYLPYKESGKHLVITGCLTQRYPAELAEEIPEADAVLGVNDYGKLPGIISALEGGYAFESNVSNTPGILSSKRVKLTPGFSSYLKIAEGCSNNCAYCIIPSIRGPYRSVPAGQLLNEAGDLDSEGCRELILIAQDLTYYGRDIYENYALPGLLRKLCASEKTINIEWFRLLYCYEERVTDELIEVMASEKRILKYIDIPIQHISGRLLKSMNRISTGESIRDTIFRLRKAMPGITLRTTFITGLPGETEQDFEELYDFAEETRFDRLGVFSYSPEEGTKAYSMPDQVEREVAEERRDVLMRLQQQISLEKNQNLIGTIQDVIVDEFDSEGSDGENVYIGRTRADAPDIDGSVIFSAPSDIRNSPYDIIGRIVKVRITDALDYDLVGVYTQD